MTVIIFIIILGALVFVHELGHFLIAKAFGVRVDEFALGFPPRIFSWQPRGSETRYALNLLPLGGYVKIFGENPNEESLTGADSGRSLVKKPKLVQVAVLIAGIVFNIVFAWLLISAGFALGLPVSASDRYAALVHDARTVVLDVSPNTPAAEAGFMPGDTILSVKVKDEVKGVSSASLSLSDTSPERIRQFIGTHGGEQLSFSVKRPGKVKGESSELTLNVVPRDGVASGRPAIGVMMDSVGTLKLPWYQALWEGLFFTKDFTLNTGKGIADFLWQAVTGRADLNQVSGPVGIASQVGVARDLGFAYLLSFTAFISINLAILNLVPFPALDGGRILFVLIEIVIRRPIKPLVANWFNGVGFVLLMILMVVVGYHDIVKLLAK